MAVTARLPLQAFHLRCKSSEAGPGIGGELQLTDGIQKLLKEGKKVVGVELRPDESWIDIGTPASYWEALGISYKNSEA